MHSSNSSAHAQPRSIPEYLQQHRSEGQEDISFEYRHGTLETGARLSPEVESCKGEENDVYQGIHPVAVS